MMVVREPSTVRSLGYVRLCRFCCWYTHVIFVAFVEGQVGLLSFLSLEYYLTCIWNSFRCVFFWPSSRARWVTAGILIDLLVFTAFVEGQVVLYPALI